MSMLARLLIRTIVVLAAAYVVVRLVTSGDNPGAPSLDALLHEHDGEPESFLQ